MKCQILFSGNNKKNIFNLSSAELAQRVVNVKGHPGKSFFIIFHNNISCGNSLEMITNGNLQHMLLWRNWVKKSYLGTQI